MGAICCLLLITTTVGLVMTNKIANAENFNLNPDYTILGLVLTILPLSMFIFLIIVLIKVICLHAANDSRKRQPGYGVF
jgi:hypothetical protein